MIKNPDKNEKAFRSSPPNNLQDQFLIQEPFLNDASYIIFEASIHDELQNMSHEIASQPDNDTTMGYQHHYRY
jgi:hypothetical protein